MEKPLTRLPEHADNMSIALISSSFSPLVLLNEDLTIIAASQSFCVAFDVDCSGVQDKKLADLGDGEWNVRQLDSLLRATVAGTAAIDVYEMDLVRPGKDTLRLLINAHTLDYFEAESTVSLWQSPMLRRSDWLIRCATTSCAKSSYCCMKYSIASPTAFKSLPVCFCRAREKCNQRKPGTICVMRTTV